LARARRSSVFSFAFFSLFHRIQWSGGGGNDDDWPASPASSRLLFFDALVLVLFTRDPFILRVMSVFTCILSGVAEEGGLR
jgi:hypothetical protein